MISGTVAYSTPLSDTLNYTSAAGEPLKFLVNATGAYVTSGNTTARIVSADIPTANGVVHIIDRVLTNTDFKSPTASSSAMLGKPFSSGVVGSAVAIFACIYAGTALL